MAISEDSRPFVSFVNFVVLPPLRQNSVRLPSVRFSPVPDVDAGGRPSRFQICRLHACRFPSNRFRAKRVIGDQSSPANSWIQSPAWLVCQNRLESYIRREKCTQIRSSSIGRLSMALHDSGCADDSSPTGQWPAAKWGSRTIVRRNLESDTEDLPRPSWNRAA